MALFTGNTLAPGAAGSTAQKPSNSFTYAPGAAGLASGIGISPSQTPIPAKTSLGITTPASTQYQPGVMTQLMGSKAKQPGGVSPSSSNSISSSYTAPPSQQQVSGTGSPTGTGSSTGTGNPSTPPNYYGTVGNLITTSQNSSPVAGNAALGLTGIGNAGSPTANTYGQQAANYGQQAAQIGQGVQDIANQFGQRYADVGQQGARFEAGQLTTGTSPVAEGNAAVTAQTTAAQQQALAQGENAALQGVGYQLTGLNQAAQAAESAGNLGIQGTQAQLTGYQGAANAGLTAQQIQQQGLTSGAQLLGPGQSNLVLGQGQTALNANGQPVASTPVVAPVGSQTQYSTYPTTYGGAQGAAQTPQQVGGGSPFTAGTVQGQANAGAQSIQNNQSIIAAQGIQQKINGLITQNGINSFSSDQFANFLHNWVSGQLSDPNQLAFGQDLMDYTQTIGPLIGIQGNPTDMRTGMTNQLLSQNVSGSSIMSLMDNINQLALNKAGATVSAGTGGTPTGLPTQGSSQGGQNSFTAPSGDTIVLNPTTGKYESQPYGASQSQ